MVLARLVLWLLIAFNAVYVCHVAVTCGHCCSLLVFSCLWGCELMYWRCWYVDCSVCGHRPSVNRWVSDPGTAGRVWRRT